MKGLAGFNKPNNGLLNEKFCARPMKFYPAFNDAQIKLPPNNAPYIKFVVLLFFFGDYSLTNSLRKIFSVFVELIQIALLASDK